MTDFAKPGDTFGNFTAVAAKNPKHCDGCMFEHNRSGCRAAPPCGTADVICIPIQQPDLVKAGQGIPAAEKDPTGRGRRAPGAKVAAVRAPGTKDTNPKQAIGDTKAPMNLIPAAAMLHESAAYAEGALKYGANNWRVAGVRVTTYVAACMRHLVKYYNGERCDPASKVHHLGNARACLGILLDAEAHNMLTDDRPPAQDLGDTVREVEEILAHLKELHKNCSPHHHTQKDFE